MSKELKVRKRPDGLTFEVFMEGGGSIPRDLEGLYTSSVIAEKAIKTFQSKVQERVQSGKRGD
jgi:hypothetical protein